MRSPIFIILTLFILLNSCSSEENPTVSKLKGKWQLTETSWPETAADFGLWYPIENGYFIEFKSSRNFTSTEFTNCGYGKYFCNEKMINFVYSCSGFKNPYHYTITELNENTLILEPDYLNCIEGCKYKFTKISN